MGGDSGKRLPPFFLYVLKPRGTKDDKFKRKSREAFDRALSFGVNPYVHRVAASEHYNDSLMTIKESWTVRDLVHSLAWIDAIMAASEVD